MGRAKLNMELIRKEKSRNITFKKRKEGLMRKIHEFTTLCDVNACMIICGPKQENSPVEPEIWPEDPDEVSRIINLYKAKSKDSGTRIFGLLDFFHERKKRMEEELEKLRKKTMEIKYPSWIDPMSHLSEIELREFACSLSNKLEVVNSRIESIKGNGDDHHHIPNRYLIMDGSHQQQQQMIDFTGTHYYNNNNTRFTGLIQRGIELELMNQQAIPPSLNPIEMQAPMYHYPTTIDQEHHQMRSINQNSMMMMLMNENDHHHHHQMQLGGTAPSCNIQCASFKHQFYYHESTAAAAGSSCGGGGGGGSSFGGGMLDNVVYNHPRPLTCYYAQTHVQPMAPYMQFPHVNVMPNVSPQMHSSRENECNEIIHYRMKDQKARH